ncbi:hypothetical protein [Saccharibacillus alkalitolerans]|uniref:Uncharacterized protein n=1 Tax=Saccharibacillus alkalitolerans TaxID=2705290 RepID=A0ABX0F9A7_9BACL|nr:hypothetical protein [Saccharibacillus alkalitolerans]NGZ76975.1 hypothetical protein [Saccharibacillus alkalitolerans]
MSFFYMVGLALAGAVVALYTPGGLGIVVVIGIVFAVGVANYRRTQELHAGMEEIRRHLGLMEQEEEKRYDLDREVRRADTLGDEEREQIDRQTEAELEKRENGGRS